MSIFFLVLDEMIMDADYRYDATGRTDDKFLDAEEMGWDAYFGTLFERLDGKMLNEHKAKYQGTFTSDWTWRKTDVKDPRKKRKISLKHMNSMLDRYPK